MRLKNKLFLISALLVLLGIFFFFFSQKKSFIPQNKEAREGRKNFERILNNPEIKESVKKIIKHSEFKEEGENARQKIVKAFEAGKISQAKMSVLKMTAYFAPDKLSKEYQADAGASMPRALRVDLQEIINNFENYSEEEKEFLEPFILAPDNPKSFFNPENKREDFFDKKLSFLSAKIAKAYSGYWESEKISAPNQPNSYVKFYIPGQVSDDYLKSVHKKFQEIREAWQRAWSKYEAYLSLKPGEGVDVYLVNLSSNDYGITNCRRNSFGKNHCRIQISKALNDKKLQSTVVHELFHFFQFNYDDMFFYGNKGADWLSEATAVWAENYIYPSYNMEHEYLNSFFPRLNEDRLKFDGYYEYGSYMFFYFLDQYNNDQNNVIETFRNFKSNHQVRKMLMQKIPDFDNIYGQFSIYNWNLYPLKQYKDTPSFPKKQPEGKSFAVDMLDNSGDKLKKEFKFAKGGMMYYYVALNSDRKKVKYVKIKFATPIDEKMQKNVLLELDGDNWNWQRLSKKTEWDFCRDKPEEDADAFVLILANSDLENKKNIKFEISASDKCPKKTISSLKITIDIKDNTGNYSFDSLFEAKQKLKYNPEESDENRKVYDIVEQTLSCHSNEKNHQSFNFGPVPIETDFSETEDGELQETYELGFAGQIFVDTKKKKATIRLRPKTKNKKWITRKNSDGVVVQKADCKMVPNDVVVDYDGSGILQGKKTIGSLGSLPIRHSSGGKADIVAEYYYVLP